MMLMPRPPLVSQCLLLRSLLLWSLLLSFSSPAQSHRRANSTSNSNVRPTRSVIDPSAARLASLLEAQQQALQQGDPAAIETATRPLAAFLLHRQADLSMLEGKFPQAVQLARKSLTLDSSSEAHLQLASLLLRSGEPREAVSEAAIVTAAEPGNASAWALRGSALRGLHDDRGAIDAFSHSLELNSNVDVAYALASSLLAAHEKAKADRILHQIITASGNAAIWHVAAGDAYREALYIDDAIAEFQRAIALDPRAPHAEFFLGLTYLQSNEWGPSSQSFEHLRAAVRLDPHDHLSNFYLGALESTDGSDLASSNRHLHAAIEADPTSPEAWLYLGLNASREHNNAEAETYLRKAIELTGDDEARNNYQIRRVYAVLGRILINEGNHAEGDALLARYKRTEQQSIGNSTQAIKQAGEAGDARAALSGIPAAKVSFPGMGAASPAAAPQYAVTPSTAATPALPRHTPEEARQIAASEQQLGLLLASSFNDLGTAQARQGQYEQALANFQEAERWQAPTPTLLHNLGAAAFRIGQFGESARALDLYLAAESKAATNSAASDDRSRMMLAMSLFSLGRFAEADKAFKPISDLTLQDPRAAYSWAYSLAHSGQQQQANRIADALAKQQLPSEVLSLVCHIYMDTESYDQSVVCFRNAYQAYPELKLAHYQVAESLIHLDRPAEAVSELQQELTLSPDNPDVRYSLAYALLQSSRKSEAIALLQSLTTSNPTHAQAQYQLGKALLEEGNATEAVNHLEQAEKNDPGPDYIHYQLQAAYRKVGRIEDADRELRVYRDIKSRNREVAPSRP
jgi:tetratricopeptide (TPR) repeat protein